MVYLAGGSNGIHYKGQNLVWNAIQKYGWKNVKHEILYTNLTKEEASKIEIEMISKYKSNDSNYGYNLTAGGEGGSFGYHHSTSDETKRKIGYKNSIALKGRKLPEEVRLKVSRANMGHIVTEETREKLRKANLGKHHSEETKRKISQYNRSRSPEVKEKISKSLKASGEARAEKRKITIQERYPDGLKQSEESNRKRSESLKGIVRSEETRQKMSEAARLRCKHRKEAQQLGMTYQEYMTHMGGSGK